MLTMFPSIVKRMRYTFAQLDTQKLRFGGQRTTVRVFFEGVYFLKKGGVPAAGRKRRLLREPGQGFVDITLGPSGDVNLVRHGSITLGGLQAVLGGQLRQGFPRRTASPGGNVLHAFLDRGNRFEEIH